MARKPKKKTPLELPEYTAEMYANFYAPSASQVSDGGGLAAELEKAALVQDRFGEEWTDQELVLLAKAVNKFPGGTPERWEKIAEMVGRSVTEVTNKSKESKGGLAIKPNTNVPGALNTKSSVKIRDEIITHNSTLEEDDDSYDYDNVKVRKRTKKSKIQDTDKKVEENEDSSNLNSSKVSNQIDNATETIKVSPDGWTQNQQTIFEWALKQYPKGTDRRWDLVAEHIPGKSKEECIARFKELAELISKKKKMDLISKSKSS